MSHKIDRISSANYWMCGYTQNSNKTEETIYELKRIWTREKIPKNISHISKIKIIRNAYINPNKQATSKPSDFYALYTTIYSLSLSISPSFSLTHTWAYFRSLFHISTQSFLFDSLCESSRTDTWDEIIFCILILRF